MDLVAGLDGRATVAFDGPDAAGKTTLADAVAAGMGERPVLRASLDGFHRPRAQRMQGDAASAEGYYRSAFDYQALRERLLDPFRAGASVVATAVYDYRSDQADVRLVGQLAADTVLLLDGVFLLRPELRDVWSLRIYVSVSEEVIMQRALTRDVDLFGSAEGVRQRYGQRYLPAQALYRAEADPTAAAHIVIDNDDHSAPKVLTWQPSR